MGEKVAADIRKHKDCIDREAKVCESLGKQHDHLSKNEGETIDIDDHRSLIIQLLLFTTKL